MEIICGLGGGGSTFVLRQLESLNYKHKKFHDYKKTLEKKPYLIKPYHYIISMLNQYKNNYIVLMRPDSYWTDWKYHKGKLNPKDEKEYIIKMINKRSAGLPIDINRLDSSSHEMLAKSYINQIKEIEKKLGLNVILIAGHWTEFGFIDKATYIIRDPFNSIISHSKKERHGKDYLNRGLNTINSKEWVLSYLEGPHHYWLNFVENAIKSGSTIVRYNHFKKDWKKTGLPDISERFIYRENNVRSILKQEIIEFIRHKTEKYCKQLGLTIY